jgi:hypothetical protein
MKFTVELIRLENGYVTGRLIDSSFAIVPHAGMFYEVSLRSDSTRASQIRVLKNLVDHLNWFVDLSEGGTK